VCQSAPRSLKRRSAKNSPRQESSSRLSVLSPVSSIPSIRSISPTNQLFDFDVIVENVMASTHSQPDVDACVGNHTLVDLELFELFVEGNQGF